MDIIVVGCGKIGTNVLNSLVSEGHDVVAIDNDPAVISEITNIYDVMSVCGNGADCETLNEAGIEKADLLIAATGSDELNMLSCFLSKKLGCSHTIARIRNPEYNDESLEFMCQQLDLSMAINPDLTAAQELFNLLKLPSAAKVEYFSGRKFEMVEIKLKDDSILDGMKLADFRDRFKAKVLICAVQRGDDVYIPDGSFTLMSGDRISITATHNEIQKIFKGLGILQKQVKSVMILGGSKTAYYLAKMLCNSGNSVKIIESNRERCRVLSDQLPKAVIIHGDGAQQELLREEGIRLTDAFVSLTGMDEENILISFFASSQNVPKVISKVNRHELSIMAEKLGLDCIVSPKDITSDIVLRYARALENSIDSSVETLYKLMDGRVEALEFNVKSSQPGITDVPLKDLETDENVLIAGIIRGRKTIIPAGDDEIMRNDRVVIIAANKRINDLSDIIKKN